MEILVLGKSTPETGLPYSVGRVLLYNVTR